MLIPAGSLCRETKAARGIPTHAFVEEIFAAGITRMGRRDVPVCARNLRVETATDASRDPSILVLGRWRALGRRYALLHAGSCPRIATIRGS